MNSHWTRAVLCVITATLLLAACATTVPSDVESKTVADAPVPDAASPAATLQPDEFDAPAAVSVAEAQKAAAGVSHAGHGAEAVSAVDPHAGHAEVSAPPKKEPSRSTQQPAAVVYTCPMHPEVKSAKPGKCPKCGMTLVKAAAKKEK